jgi:hypothetical protein
MNMDQHKDSADDKDHECDYGCREILEACTPEGDDGNCKTAIKCTVCEKVLTAGKADHIAKADDNDCTTAVTCQNCPTVIVEAKSHDYTGEYSMDKDGHWHVCANEGCMVTDTKVAHTAGPEATETDDQICTVCDYVITPSLGHTHTYNTLKYDAQNH